MNVITYATPLRLTVKTEILNVFEERNDVTVRRERASSSLLALQASIMPALYADSACTPAARLLLPQRLAKRRFHAEWVKTTH